MPANETFGTRVRFTKRETVSWMASGDSLHERTDGVGESACASQRQKEMSFLRTLMLYDETDESRQLEDKIRQAEGNERCVRRALAVMGVLTGLSLAGLGYSVLLLEDFFQNSFQLLIRLFAALGLAAAFSLTAFLLIWAASRAALDDQREKCRRLVARIMAARLGDPRNTSLLHPSRGDRRATEVAEAMVPVGEEEHSNRAGSLQV